MKRLQTAIMLLALAFICGCTSVRSVSYEDNARAQKPEGAPVEVLDEANVDRPYKVIGVVEANAGKLRPMKESLDKLKAEARKMGGDAIIDVQRGAGPGMVAPAGGAMMYGSLRDFWTAKVIVWQVSQEPRRSNE